MGAPNGGTGRFGKPQIAHLSFLHQIRHGAHCVFDGRLGIHAMLVVKIDHIDVQPLKRSLAAGANIFGTAANSQEFSIGRPLIAELGGEHHLLAAASNRLAYQRLILTDSVHVRGVQEAHSPIERQLNGGDGFCVVGFAIKLRHAHASQTHAGNFESKRT